MTCGDLAVAFVYGMIFFCLVGGLGLLLKEIIEEYKDRERMASRNIRLEKPVKKYYQGFTKK